jgi:AcrR family transcriptional regulator
MTAKERILLKAGDLFDKYGIRSVTMDDIASQLGMSKKTIYLSYKDKDELVDDVFQCRIMQSRNQCMFDRERAENPIHEVFLSMEMVGELLKSMHRNILYDLEKYHPNVFAKYLQYKSEFIGKIISENLALGKEMGLYRSELNIDIITKVRLTTMMLSFNNDLFPISKFNGAEVEYEIIYHFLYGISTPKGVKMVEKYKQKIKSYNTK